MFSVTELIANAVVKNPALSKRLLSVVLYTQPQTHLPVEVRNFLRQPVSRADFNPQTQFDLISLIVMWAVASSPFSGGDESLRIDLRDLIDKEVHTSELVDLEQLVLREISQ